MNSRDLGLRKCSWDTLTPTRHSIYPVCNLVSLMAYLSVAWMCAVLCVSWPIRLCDKFRIWNTGPKTPTAGRSQAHPIFAAAQDLRYRLSSDVSLSREINVLYTLRIDDSEMLSFLKLLSEAASGRCRSSSVSGPSALDSATHTFEQLVKIAAQTLSLSPPSHVR